MWKVLQGNTLTRYDSAPVIISLRQTPPALAEPQTEPLLQEDEQVVDEDLEAEIEEDTEPDEQDPIELEEDVLDPSLLVDSYEAGEEETSPNTTEDEQQDLEYGAQQPLAIQEQAVQEDSSVAVSEQAPSLETVVTTDNAEAVERNVATPTETVSTESQQTVESDVFEDVEVPDESPKEAEQLADLIAEINEESNAYVVSDEMAELQIPPEFLGNLGNMQQLTELDLGEAFVADPTGEKEAKEYRLVNKVLKRIFDQVMEHWRSPRDGRSQRQGEILVDLDPYGNLIDARLKISSGHQETDLIAMNAIRSVGLYRTHFNPEVNKRYFTHLRFIYTTLRQEYESLPFETAGGSKE